MGAFDRDRDAAIRTAYGEDVYHPGYTMSVIFNRTQDKRWSPNAFGVVSNGEFDAYGGRLYNSLRPTDPIYQQLGTYYDNLMGGKVAPATPATHFLNPSLAQPQKWQKTLAYQGAVGGQLYYGTPQYRDNAIRVAAPAAGVAAAAAPATQSAYVAPVTGTFESGAASVFGAGRDGSKRMHSGSDWGAAAGSPVVAAIGGRVVYTGNDDTEGGYRHFVDVLGSDGNVYRYAPHASVSVKVGQMVEQGQQIGTVGAASKKGSPHLHMEVIPPNSPAYAAALKGEFGKTSWYGGKPFALNQEGFFGLKAGAQVAAGQAFTAANPASVAMEQPPFNPLLGASGNQPPGLAPKPDPLAMVKPTANTDAWLAQHGAVADSRDTGGVGQPLAYAADEPVTPPAAPAPAPSPSGAPSFANKPANQLTVKEQSQLSQLGYKPPFGGGPQPWTSPADLAKGKNPAVGGPVPITGELPPAAAPDTSHLTRGFTKPAAAVTEPVKTASASATAPVTPGGVSVSRPADVHTGNALGDRMLNDVLQQNALDLNAIGTDWGKGNPVTFGGLSKYLTAGAASGAVQNYVQAHPDVAARVKGLADSTPMTPAAKAGMDQLFGSSLNGVKGIAPAVPLTSASPHVLPTPRPGTASPVEVASADPAVIPAPAAAAPAPTFPQYYGVQPQATPPPSATRAWTPSGTPYEGMRAGMNGDVSTRFATTEDHPAFVAARNARLGNSGASPADLTHPSYPSTPEYGAPGTISPGLLGFGPAPASKPNNPMGYNGGVSIPPYEHYLAQAQQAASPAPAPSYPMPEQSTYSTMSASPPYGSPGTISPSMLGIGGSGQSASIKSPIILSAAAPAPAVAPPPVVAPAAPAVPAPGVAAPYNPADNPLNDQLMQGITGFGSTPPAIAAPLNPAVSAAPLALAAAAGAVDPVTGAPNTGPRPSGGRGGGGSGGHTSGGGGSHPMGGFFLSGSTPFGQYATGNSGYGGYVPSGFHSPDYNSTSGGATYPWQSNGNGGGTYVTSDGTRYSYRRGGGINILRS